MDKIKSIFTPQVRMFLYGAVAAVLSVATSKGWVTDDLAKSINDNIPTILGALGAILAAANVKVPATPAKPVAAPAAPATPVRALEAQVTHVPQLAAVEETI